jgi:hypothetical protein
MARQLVGPAGWRMTLKSAELSRGSRSRQGVNGLAEVQVQPVFYRGVDRCGKDS